MADDDLVVKARLDDQGASKGLHDLADELHKTADAGRDAAAGAKAAESAITEQAQSADRLHRMLNRATSLGLKPFTLAGRGSLSVVKSLGSGVESLSRRFGHNLVGALRDATRAGDRFRHSSSNGWGIGDTIKRGIIYTGIYQLAQLGKQAISTGVSTAAGMENATIGFTTMLGSARKAHKFLAQLAAFAAATPFDLPGLQRSASSLISIGVRARDVIPIMTTLGNVTSGMGTGAEGIQRATVALQQMIAAQAIHAQDLNQLRDAGIPVYDLLSKAMGKSKKEVADLVQAGKLGKPALDAMMKALRTGNGLERFNGLMEKQSRSLSGLWSTAKDTFSIGMAGAIKPLIPLIKKGLGGAISGITDAASWMGDHAPKAIHKIVDAGKDVIDFFKRGYHAAQPIIDALHYLGFNVAEVWRTRLLPAIEDLWDEFGPKASDATSAVQTLADWIAKLAHFIEDPLGPAITHVVGWLIDNHDAVAAFFKTILFAIGVLKAFRLVMIGVNIVMDANPIGLVVLAIAALVAGFIWARKHSTRFKDVTDKIWYYIKLAALGAIGAIILALRGMLDVFTGVAQGILEGVAWILRAFHKDDWAKQVSGAADAIGEFRDKANGYLGGIQKKITLEIQDQQVKDKLRQLHNWVRDHPATMIIQYQVNSGGNYTGGTGGRRLSMDLPMGDTATARGWGPARLDKTIRSVAYAAGMAGLGRYQITNAMVGGGGRGHGSGDHQAGRALDLVGPNMPALVRAINAAGGYATEHGLGAGRHVHAVPAPVGDTPTPRGAMVPSKSGLAVAPVIVHAPITVSGPVSDEQEHEIQRRFERMLRRAIQNAQERS